jgi:carboxyl-terminal processing protease
MLHLNWAMKHKFTLFVLLVITVAALVGGTISRASRKHLVPSGPDPVMREASSIEDDFAGAVETVASNYAGDVDYERATQAAIQGMLSTLDPHSNYFSRAEFTRLQQDQDSRFFGIGVTILQHRDGVYVQTTVPDTPAAKAGLRYGDRIIEVDGEDARDWTSQQVSKRVRGDWHKAVKIKVERAGLTSPMEFTIIRDSVPLPSIRDSFMIRPATGYIGLTGGFQHTTDDELREAIGNLHRQGMRQLILDLRGNPGGLLEQAIDVASEFLDRGKVVVSVKGRKEYSQPYVYKSKGSDNGDFPLVVLINGGTASASEIVSGAIQDHGRGLLIGETSFGKGLVQRVYPLLFGTGLTLTTAHYYTPYGRLIQRDYSSGSFYDYYTRHDAQTDQPEVKPGAGAQASPSPFPSPSPTPPSGPGVKTAGGRIFYGGGGITPDIEVKPLRITPTRQLIGEASFYFTRQLAGGQVSGMESYKIDKVDLGHDLKASDYPINERLLDAFKTFIQRNPEGNLSPAEIAADLDFVKLRLRMEIVMAAYGGDANQRALLESDPQVLRAFEALPDSKRLADSTKNDIQVG